MGHNELSGAWGFGIVLLLLIFVLKGGNGIFGGVSCGSYAPIGYGGALNGSDAFKVAEIETKHYESLSAQIAELKGSIAQDKIATLQAQVQELKFKEALTFRPASITNVANAGYESAGYPAAAYPGY